MKNTKTKTKRETKEYSVTGRRWNWWLRRGSCGLAQRAPTMECPPFCTFLSFRFDSLRWWADLKHLVFGEKGTKNMKHLVYGSASCGGARPVRGWRWTPCGAPLSRSLVSAAMVWEEPSSGFLARRNGIVERMYLRRHCLMQSAAAVIGWKWWCLRLHHFGNPRGAEESKRENERGTIRERK